MNMINVISLLSNLRSNKFQLPNKETHLISNELHPLDKQIVIFDE